LKAPSNKHGEESGLGVNGENGENGNGAPMDAGFVRRFERAQDQNEKDIQRIGNEVYSVKSQTEFIQRDISKITTSIETLAAKLEERGKTNWPAVFAILPMIPMLAGLLGMYVAYSISPVNAKLDLHESNIAHVVSDVTALSKLSQENALAAVGSRTDRADLNERVRLLQTGLATETLQRREAAAAMRVNLSEIETQFCSSDIVRNLMHANDLRNVSLLWQKVNGVPYPIENAYYPTVCQHKDGFQPAPVTRTGE
jgi:hypothetical protein